MRARLTKYDDYVCGYDDNGSYYYLTRESSQASIRVHFVSETHALLHCYDKELFQQAQAIEHNVEENLFKDEHLLMKRSLSSKVYNTIDVGQAPIARIVQSGKGLAALEIITCITAYVNSSFPRE